MPECAWCGVIASAWVCPVCRSKELRPITVGSDRTAEELGRAFPHVPVRLSAGARVLASVPATPSIVVATQGAEPRVDGGYGCLLVLDAQQGLARSDLRAAEESLRRWMGAASLVRAKGPVVVVADGSLPVVQAMVRWDPLGFSEREARERAALRFPPAVRMASLEGEPGAIADALLTLSLPPGAEVLGPVDVVGGSADEQRVLIRIERSRHLELAEALRVLAVTRSARKGSGRLRIQLDPRELL